MDFTIVDILSMGASISTMIGLLIAIVSLWNYYGEKREKLEYEVKKHFFDGISWKRIQEKNDVDNDTSYDFRLNITNGNFHSFTGEIKILNFDGTESNPIEEIVMFHFRKIKKDKITVEILQGTESPEGVISIKELGEATLRFMNPGMFEITFNESNLPNFPHIAYLMSQTS